MSARNETAAPCISTKAARDSRKNPPGSYRKSPPDSTRRPRGPFPNWNLRALARHELLGVYLEIEGALVSLTDARARRAAALLAGELPANEEQERRAWNDRPRGAA